MKKLIFTGLFITAFIITGVIFATAIQTAHDTAEKNYNISDIAVNITYNGKPVEYELAPVIIDGHTYVPLRESADKSGLDVDWDSETNTVLLTSEEYEWDCENNSIIFSENAVSGYSQFDYLFGLELPDSAEFEGFDFRYEYFEPHLKAKIIMTASDAEAFKKEVESKYRKNEDDETEIYNVVLANYSKWYDWWDLSELPEGVEIYESFESGLFVMTLDYQIFFVPAEKDMCCVYVSM